MNRSGLSKYERQFESLGIVKVDHYRRPHRAKWLTKARKKAVSLNNCRKTIFRQIRFFQVSLYKAKVMRDKMWIEIYYRHLNDARCALKQLGYLNPNSGVGFISICQKCGKQTEKVIKVHTPQNGLCPQCSHE